MIAANNLPSDRIEQELKKLVGLRAWGAGLTAGMLKVSFGDRRQHIKKTGEVVEVGEYALYALSPWRFARADGVIVGFVDYLNASEDGRVNKIHDYLKRVLEGEPAVEAVAYVRAAGFSLALADGLYFEVFPSASPNEPETEFWRMFQPASASNGFEVGAAGIRVDD